MASRLDDLAQLHFQALDGIGRVDHAPDVWREDEERRDVLPDPLPGSDDRGVLGSPGPIGERLQRLLGRLFAGRGVEIGRRAAATALRSFQPA